jgi:hypothetical protein
MNVADRKRNYFFNSKSTDRIHLKTDNKLSWTYLLQQRKPHKQPWRAGCGQRAVVWAALVYKMSLFLITEQQEISVRVKFSETFKAILF